MGLHEWAYKNDYNPVGRAEDERTSTSSSASRSSIVEVEMGFSAEQTAREVERCLNCDVQTVFTDKLCIECDACIDVCPVLCLTIAPNGEEPELRKRLSAPAHQPRSRTSSPPGRCRRPSA